MKELEAVALLLTMASLWRVDVIESSIDYRDGLLLTSDVLDASGGRPCDCKVRYEKHRAVLT